MAHPFSPEAVGLPPPNFHGPMELCADRDVAEFDGASIRENKKRRFEQTVLPLVQQILDFARSERRSCQGSATQSLMIEGHDGNSLFYAVIGPEEETRRAEVYNPGTPPQAPPSSSTEPYQNTTAIPLVDERAAAEAATVSQRSAPEGISAVPQHDRDVSLPEGVSPLPETPLRSRERNVPSSDAEVSDSEGETATPIEGVSTETNIPRTNRSVKNEDVPDIQGWERIEALFNQRAKTRKDDDVGSPDRTKFSRSPSDDSRRFTKAVRSHFNINNSLDFEDYINEGSDHATWFKCILKHGGVTSIGEGSTKKDAFEKAAPRIAEAFNLKV